MVGPTATPATAPITDRRWQALAVLALVQFIIVIDQTVVNVALPSIQRDLGASASGLAWVVNGYLLTAGGLLLLGGRVSDLLGRRRIFLVGTALFAAASLGAGAAPTAEVLIACRFAQGAGEALASPAALSLLAVLFTDRVERARALGIWGGLAGLGATVGVVLSGVITEVTSWRWIFLINLPVTAVALVAVPRLVRADQRTGRGSVDVLGAVLVTGSLIAVVHGLLQAAEHSWTAPAVLVPVAAGLAGLAAFVAVEARVSAPLMPLRFFANATRVSANLCTVLLTSAMAAMFFLLTLYMQQALGYGPLQAGLAYLPFCLAFIPGLIATTALTGRGRIRTAIVAGFLISAAGMLLLSLVTPATGYVTHLLPATMILAVGLGMGLPALQNAALHKVSDADAGLASGMQTAVQQLGSALGLAVLVTIALRAADPAATAAGASTSGYQLAFTAAAGTLAAGALLVLILMRRVRTPSAAA